MSPSFIAQWLRLLVFQGAGLALAAATVALAAAAVPPAVYGQYGLMLSMVQIASGVGLLWLHNGLLRYGREEFRTRGSANDTIAAAIALAAVVLAAIVLAAWLCAPMLAAWTGLTSGNIAVVTVCLVALATFELMSYAAQARGRLDGYAGGQIIARAGPFAGVAAMAIGLGSSAPLLMACAGVGWLLAAIWTGKGAFAGGFRPTSTWRDRIAPIVTYGRLLPLSVAASLLSQWMGLWFVRSNVGVAEAGVLLWAMGLFNLLAGIMQPLGAVLGPRMVDLRLEGGEQEVRDRLAVIIAAGLLLAALAPAVLAAARLVGIALLPAAYAGATPLVCLLLASFPALLVASGLAPLLAAYENFVPRIVVLNLATCALNLACLVALVPRLGAVGAALSTMLTSVASSTGFLVLAGTTLATAGRAGLLGRQALIAAWPVLTGILLVTIDAVPGSIAAVGATLAGLALGRATGAFHPLAGLRPHLASSVVGRLPQVLHLLDWLSTPRRTKGL